MLRFLFCLPFFKCGSGTGDQELAIRKFIRKSVKKGASLEEVDGRIREKFGEDAIVYKELDYWYYQFYNGKKSMKDKRSPSDATPLELLDLPNEMIHSIFSNLPINDKFNLQLVSTRIASLADLRFEYLEVDIMEGSMDFSFKPILDTLGEISVPLNMGYSRLKLLLARSELKLKNLSIYECYCAVVDGSAVRNMEKILGSFDHQLHAEHFSSFNFLRDLLTLLPFFKPEILRGITVYEIDEPVPFTETIQELVEIEQWNKLKKININFQWRDPLIFYPIEHFFQFEEIGVADPIRAIEDSPELFIWIRQLLMTSPNIKLIVARFEIPFRDVCSSLDDGIEIEWDEDQDGIAHWRMPEATFIIGRNPQLVSQMFIMKENSVNFYVQNVRAVNAQ